MKRCNDINFYSTDLFLGMLDTVATKLLCSCPAFCEGAVTLPTVRLAGLEPADHLVGAA